MIFKKLKIGIFSALMTLLLIGCNNAGTEESTDEEIASVNKFEMTAMDASYIGDVNSKYSLDQEKEGISTDAISSKVFNELSSVGSVSAKLENEDNPLVFEQGIFYQFKTTFVTTEAYPDGLGFDFTLVNEDENVSEESLSKTFAYGYVEDLNETGEHILEVDMKIPVDIQPGSYMLIVKVLDIDLQKMVDEGKDINEIPEVGAIYVTIEESSISNQVVLLSSSSEQYIDLSTDMTFAEDYTNQEVSSANIVLSNESNESYELEVSGVLELESGQTFRLGLLDNSDGTIKERTSFLINESNQIEANTKDVSLSYYIAQSDYAELLALLPDLSVDEERDGLKGKVVWTVNTVEDDVLIGSKENELLLSKFTQNYNADIIATEAITSKATGTSIVSKTSAKSFVNNGVLFNYGSGINLTKGDKKKVAINFESNYDVTGLWSVPGVASLINGDINFYILNRKITLLGLESKAVLSSLKQHSKLNDKGKRATRERSEGAKITATIFNVDFYKKNSLTTSTVTGTMSSDKNAASNKTLVSDTKTRSSKKKSYKMPNYEWEEKRVFFRQRFMAGPIPMQISAGIIGNFQIITAAGLEGVGILVTGSTPLSVNVFLEGGVSLALAEAGIRGEFILTESSGNGSLRVGLTIDNNNRLGFDIKAKSWVNLQLIRGAFSVYANSKTKIKWCKKKIIFKKIKYPCGLTWEKNDFYFYKTNWAFKRKWTLLNKTIPLYRLPE